MAKSFILTGPHWSVLPTRGEIPSRPSIAKSGRTPRHVIPIGACKKRCRAFGDWHPACSRIRLLVSTKRLKQSQLLILYAHSFEPQSLRKHLLRHNIASSPELKTALGTRADLTVFGKLKILDYTCPAILIAAVTMPSEKPPVSTMPACGRRGTSSAKEGSIAQTGRASADNDNKLLSVR